MYRPGKDDHGGGGEFVGEIEQMGVFLFEGEEEVVL